ncbi:MAG: hypothetical protein ACFFEN_06380 [Candidatus Thorarchaeota archaeon]
MRIDSPEVLGLYIYTYDAIYAYSEAGVYTITLTVLDCYGNTYTSKNILLLERAPVILGSFVINLNQWI